MQPEPMFESVAVLDISYPVEDVGGALKLARGYRGLTTGQAAAALGVARSTLWRIEEGRTKGIGGDLLAKLAKLYRMNVSFRGAGVVLTMEGR